LFTPASRPPPPSPPYPTLSDCWSATNRSATGELQPDPARFPSGIPALVSYLQPRGLGLGLYTCAGTKTCKYGRPGSFGHYRRDADTLIGWGWVGRACARARAPQSLPSKACPLNPNP